MGGGGEREREREDGRGIRLTLGSRWTGVYEMETIKSNLYGVTELPLSTHPRHLDLTLISPRIIVPPPRLYRSYFVRVTSIPPLPPLLPRRNACGEDQEGGRNPVPGYADNRENWIDRREKRNPPSLSRYSQRRHDAFRVWRVIRGFTEKTRKQGVRIKRSKQWILRAMCRGRGLESVLCKQVNVRNTHIPRWLILRERRRTRP